MTVCLAVGSILLPRRRRGARDPGGRGGLRAGDPAGRGARVAGPARHRPPGERARARARAPPPAAAVRRALAPPTLESLARSGVWQSVPPSTVVIREGDPGERFFVLETGSVDVSRGGEFVRTLSAPGDGFGEIALLRNVPRTATVTATSDTQLLGIGRTRVPRRGDGTGGGQRDGRPDRGHLPRSRGRRGRRGVEALSRPGGPALTGSTGIVRRRLTTRPYNPAVTLILTAMTPNTLVQVSDMRLTDAGPGRSSTRPPPRWSSTRDGRCGRSPVRRAWVTSRPPSGWRACWPTTGRTRSSARSAGRRTRSFVATPSWRAGSPWWPPGGRARQTPCPPVSPDRQLRLRHGRALASDARHRGAARSATRQGEGVRGGRRAASIAPRRDRGSRAPSRRPPETRTRGMSRPSWSPRSPGWP